MMKKTYLGGISLILLMAATIALLSPWSLSREKTGRQNLIKKRPSVAEATQNLKPRKGFHTLYQGKDRLLCQIEKSQLNRPFLLAMTVTRGLYTGMQWDHMVVYWQKRDGKMYLIRPDYRHRGTGATTKNMVSRTFPYSILRTASIVGETGHTWVVDLSSIFKTDLAGLAAEGTSLFGADVSFNAALSRWSSVKVFPKNLEIEVEAAYTGARTIGEPPNFTDSTDDERSHVVGIHYSLSQLPESSRSYRPREADPRVGYFTTAVKDFSKSYRQKSYFKRYIERWHLEKVDSNLQLSPPKKAIVFYLSHSIPHRFRQYVREGILEWNKAFEKIGFSQAIEVHQQTKTQFADLDPADVRYNFVVWTTSELGYAYGPSRVHPLTGQILDADIIFEDSLLRFIQGEAEVLLPDRGYGEDEKFLNLYRKLPGFGSSLARTYRPRQVHRHRPVARRTGRHICRHQRGLRHQLQLGSLYFASLGKTIPPEVMGSYVRETIMHEVGHTLGLYHNFKGSTWLDLKKINSKEQPAATSASVMDYNGVNYLPPKKTQGHYSPQTIGPYDYWVIEYGYKPVSSGQKGKKELDAIASRAPEKGLAYGNDLYVSLTDPDPRTAKWDMGDPLEFAVTRIQLVEHLLPKLVKHTTQKGQSFFAVRRAAAVLLTEYRYACYLLARHVGGAYINHYHRGDKGAPPPIRPIPQAVQEKAFVQLAKTIFSPDGFKVPPSVQSHLAPGIHWHWDSDQLSPQATFPLHQAILEGQLKVLAVLVHPKNLWRLQNLPQQVADPTKAFGLADLMDGLTEAIWVELSTDPKKWDGKTALTSSFRRNLQRRYLRIWGRYFLLAKGSEDLPDDVRSLARNNLIQLETRIALWVKVKNLDRMSLVHLQKCGDDIQKLLEAEYGE